MRATGNSFRVCLRALLEASEGGEVTIVTQTAMNGNELISRMRRMAENTIHLATKDEILIKGGGIIRLEVLKQRKGLTLLDY